MILKTKEFQEVANKILLATSLDKNACNLEMKTKGHELYLNVTNKEFFVSVKFAFEQDEELHATVDALLFLSLVSGLTSDTFNLGVKDNHIIVSAGRSNYKIAMIYEGDKLMTLPPITIVNKTVEMDIQKDILDSILNVNSKELAKVKGLGDIKNELFELYYIDEAGCFTFTTGACLNAFKLEKPVKLLLNERIVKLFRLFSEDVHFSLGQDPLPNGMIRTKMSMETQNVYLAAIITCDDLLISKVQGPCAATKRFIAEPYQYRLVLSSTLLKDAINRLLLFVKNSAAKPNMHFVPMVVTVNADEFVIKDQSGNTESIPVENGSYADGTYEMPINIIDLKMVVDSCKNEHFTLSCGNGRSIVISRGAISNLIPEAKAK